MSPSKVIGILGMHRSGTSCLTGCLQERGLYLGDVVNSAPNNLKGNKENLEFRALNDDVLKFNNGSWDRPPQQLSWTTDFSRRRDSLFEGFQGNKVWGFKDPRTLLTLPFWMAADIELNWVATFRHPLAVAASLEARKGLLPATPSLELWKAYNLRLLQHVQQTETALVCFDLPAPAYQSAVDVMAEKLGLSTPSLQDIDFYDESLRHRQIEDFSGVSCDIEYLKLYETLLQHAQSQ